MKRQTNEHRLRGCVAGMAAAMDGLVISAREDIEIARQVRATLQS
jgi:hypothetical protein